ncbi:hypothetical protein ACTNNG_004538 [Vibrio parahaemolyticus]|uniref:hypothetical protein n=1 Tax=Vibrio parahaemolyticus TaxID=670 RepID=UPI00146B80E1|nr:hypothetical protein [Vibrio parahaemolyticus]EJB5271563.1 hypothetical protein [Vibrio vulnificus]EJC6850783.1 hypothetical protein [Vibrio parahaemolyticus]EJC7138192.1 hypothetical protein [Vibrio parahaemolyticus]EKG9570753.1 hypothetical protein [Vibrio parahaemolyticus]EKG9575548.1 hypothetical protein [Vibrio parahaemolyticus]
MIAKILYPKENVNGNLLWNKSDFSDKGNQISDSLKKLKPLGYWASAFPEGDGITFSVNKGVIKTDDNILSDFRDAFNWVAIESTSCGDGNTVLAELESEDTVLDCTVIVPLEKIYLQETLEIGIYKFVCRKEFDPEPFERLSEFTSEYLQFDTSLNYRDLLKLNKTIEHNDIVINKCLSLAEHALDLVRFTHSSFMRPELTPNPAGQVSNGFYSVDIIPRGSTHLKPFELSGISRPLSVSNNWLGPQVDDLNSRVTHYLASLENSGANTEMELSAKIALRSLRQSFYSLGSESQFLNLIFTLDGLAEPESNWRGWKQRTYIAALVSKSSPSTFEQVLESYDTIYTDVRNKLVHEGKDFYELSSISSNEVCEEIFGYIKDIITLISTSSFTTKQELKDYATNLLQRTDFEDAYTQVITRVSNARGKNVHLPSW